MLTVLDAGNLDFGAVGCDGDRFSVQTMMIYWVFYLLLKPVRHYCGSCGAVAVLVDRLTPGHLVRNQNRTHEVIAKSSHHCDNILKIHPE